MVQEDYVSYEVAKLLKEKEFDEDCIMWYEDDDYLVHTNDDYGLQSNSDHISEYFEYSAPTLQMAMKWLREVHHKHCTISYDIDLYWFFQIIELKELKEHFDYSELIRYHTENETGFNSYEEAVEAALKYTLEKLI